MKKAKKAKKSAPRARRRARADEAARAILRRAFDELLALEVRVAHEGDPVSLHAFRVALRRIRSVLRELDGVLPEPERGALARALRRLAHLTSPVRDLDVVLGAFGRYGDAVPARHRRHLRPLRKSLEAQRERAFRELVEAMTTEKRRRLEATFERFEAAAPSAKRPPSLEAIARARTERLGKRIRKHGRAMTPESEARDLHELRKEVKRLRYLLELFEEAFPRSERRALLRDLKDLQDLLGEFQDREAHLRILERTALEPLEGAGPKTPLAAGMLLKDLERAQRTAREAMPKAFRRFDRRKARAHLRAATRAV